jgi:predicted transcriptional regulator YheO
MSILEERDFHPCLKVVLQMMQSLAEMLGCRYELILHDLSHLESSVVAVQGNITNRKPGAPATNFLIQMLKKYGDDAPNSVNYKNVLPDGRILRSSTTFIRDGEGHIIGSLCINQDLTDFMVVGKLINEFTSFSEPEDEDHPHQEVFAYDISEVMESMVQSELDAVRIPAAYMQKEDKRAIVQRLKEKGIFDIKGSVEYVAERLGVTNFTIYNYLKEVRCTQR